MLQQSLKQIHIFIDIDQNILHFQPSFKDKMWLLEQISAISAFFHPGGEPRKDLPLKCKPPSNTDN